MRRPCSPSRDSQSLRVDERHRGRDRWEGVGSDAICGGLKALSASAFLLPPHLSIRLTQVSNGTLKGKSFALTPGNKTDQPRTSTTLHRLSACCGPSGCSLSRPSFNVKVGPEWVGEVCFIIHRAAVGRCWRRRRSPAAPSPLSKGEFNFWPRRPPLHL